MGRRRGEAVEHPSARLQSGAIARIIPSPFADGQELLVDDTPQSHVNLNDPRHLHFEYVARMGAVIDQLQPPRTPLTAIHLGAGGLTLPRYIEATRPGSRQQVIELEPALVDLVRACLPLPRGAAIRVRIGDARDGLRRLPRALVGHADLVISDVYSGARTPAHLTSREFYTEIAAVLAPAGVLLVNVADGPGLAFARRQVATVQSALSEVAVLADAQVIRGRRFGNLVIAASATPFPPDWRMRVLAPGPHPAVVAHGTELRAFTAGAIPVNDTDAVDSPRPDADVFCR